MTQEKWSFLLVCVPVRVPVSRLAKQFLFLTDLTEFAFTQISAEGKIWEISVASGLGEREDGRDASTKNHCFFMAGAFPDKSMAPKYPLHLSSLLCQFSGLMFLMWKLLGSCGNYWAALWGIWLLPMDSVL